jgi:hypothetical protein
MPSCKPIPGFKQQHYVMYVMNKCRGTFDVLDSKTWPKGKKGKKILARSVFHTAHIKETVSLFCSDLLVAYHCLFAHGYFNLPNLFFLNLNF